MPAAQGGRTPSRLANAGRPTILAERLQNRADGISLSFDKTAVGERRSHGKVGSRVSRSHALRGNGSLAALRPTLKGAAHATTAIPLLLAYAADSRRLGGAGLLSAHSPNALC